MNATADNMASSPMPASDMPLINTSGLNAMEIRNYTVNFGQQHPAASLIIG